MNVRENITRQLEGFYKTQYIENKSFILLQTAFQYYIKCYTANFSSARTHLGNLEQLFMSLESKDGK